jgi:integrase
MKTNRFPIVVTREGVTAKIHRASQIQNGQTYSGFMVVYSLLGKRKRVWRSDLSQAEIAAEDACEKISSGQHLSLSLVNTDRMAYLRATEALSPVGVKLDVAAQEYASAVTLLGGRATITEACRDWMKHHATELPRFDVSKAVNEIVQQARADGKSAMRLKQLSNVLDRFAESFNVAVQDVSPTLISQYLARLPLAERTRKNHRDVIKFFNRFCVLRGYLKKGTDWLEGVQNYSARKLGAIEIYTPDEMKLLLSKADKRLVPFLAIGAFAGLRHAEIARLDWSEIELADGAGESFIEVRADKAKTQTRRIVPVKDNLKAWLLPHRKAAGKVCPFENTTKQLLKTAAATGEAAKETMPLKWKKNALRHSCISYRVAECGDVPRVSDESGNSVQVIRSNYLRRVKPASAAEWFGIMPPHKTGTRKLDVRGVDQTLKPRSRRCHALAVNGKWVN